jgi:hypothetical protein
MQQNFVMNTSLRGLERSNPKGWKFWAKLSTALIFLFAVLTFFSPSFHDKHCGVAQNESAAVGYGITSRCIIEKDPSQFLFAVDVEAAVAAILEVDGCVPRPPMDIAESTITDQLNQGLLVIDVLVFAILAEKVVCAVHGRRTLLGVIAIARFQPVLPVIADIVFHAELGVGHAEAEPATRA